MGREKRKKRRPIDLQREDDRQAEEAPADP